MIVTYLVPAILHYRADSGRRQRDHSNAGDQVSDSDVEHGVASTRQRVLRVLGRDGV